MYYLPPYIWGGPPHSSGPPVGGFCNSSYGPNIYSSNFMNTNVKDLLPGCNSNRFGKISKKINKKYNKYKSSKYNKKYNKSKKSKKDIFKKKY